ncbi:MAG TPA: hypothetical protein VF592_05810 [Sphingomonas sp.]|jgi:hypothetical protein|uniref:hypothetical protein n=1 Tax=Sphingomonas sp. TaxID=28214 RepID=UPI002ED8D356
MSATMHQGAASAAPTIAAFLATGGRIMLSPRGKLSSTPDLRRLFDPDTGPEEAREALCAAREYAATERRHRSRIAALVVGNGAITPNGWLVWENRA